MTTDRCRVPMRGKLHECGRPTVGSRHSCIFHLSNRTPEQDDYFIEELKSELELMFSDPSHDYIDFTRFIFPSSIFPFNRICKTFAKALILEHAISPGGADFSNSTFEGEADFFRASFGGREGFVDHANFNSCTFKSKVSFWATDFGGGSGSNPGVEFRHAVFVGPAEFNSATFEAWATFSQAEFQAKALFSKASFKGKTDFSSTNFAKEAEFRETSFAEGDFSYAEFFDEVQFIETKFPGDFILSPNSVLIAKGIFFRDVQFVAPEKVQFRGLETTPIDLRNVSFLSIDIDRVVFVDEKWASKLSAPGLRKRTAVIDEELIALSERYMDHPLKQSLPTYEKVKQLYRRLRKNYESAARYAEAGDFFIGEMEMRRLDTKVKNRFLRWLCQNFSLIALYRLLSLYGESYRRLLAWSVVIVIAFTVLRVFALPIGAPKFSLYVILSQIGNSISAFLQLPRGHSGLDITERILSAPIIGLLLVSLKRNFERK